MWLSLLCLRLSGCATHLDGVVQVILQRQARIERKRVGCRPARRPTSRERRYIGHAAHGLLSPLPHSRTSMCRRRMRYADAAAPTGKSAGSTLLVGAGFAAIINSVAGERASMCVRARVCVYVYVCLRVVACVGQVWRLRGMVGVCVCMHRQTGTHTPPAHSPFASQLPRMLTTIAGPLIMSLCLGRILARIAVGGHPVARDLAQQERRQRKGIHKVTCQRHQLGTQLRPVHRPPITHTGTHTHTHAHKQTHMVRLSV
jgi:hypothetical protein